MKRFILASLLMSAAATAFAAAPLNQIPSCYAANKMELAVPAQQREVFLLLDQTVELDQELKQSLADTVRGLMSSGTSFQILRFSAFSQGRYLDMVATGALEQSVPESARNSVGVKTLKSFDSCIKGQLEYGARLALSATGKTLEQSSSALSNSDVLASLAETSKLVKASTAPRRIVLIVSDMLENSTVSSFYAGKGVRKIDPEKEIQAVQKNNLFGDFGGATIFVMGAGIISEQGAATSKAAQKNQYRDPKTLNALKQFWGEYFTKSNGRLEEFGMPALLSPVR
ncbi:hypothetical protein PQR62_06645 [Herbaspirillum lusitanum]|uniref:VWFA domain-containing protein n=1 Tax=Herbaspirillum lusitanum TaxID=213312 RepID=A0ABW9A6C5_9BURK